LRVVAVASDGLEAVLKSEELQPDLILLDIGLPTISGIEAARRIRKVAPKSKILFCSQEGDVDVARMALSEGGHGYVVKSDANNELFPAVEAVMQGKKFVSCRLAGPASTNLMDSQMGDALRTEDAIAPPPDLILQRKGVTRCHAVHFYSDDSLFLDGFTRFIGTALRNGSTAVFIGTGYAGGGNVTLGYIATILAIFTAYVRAAGKIAGAPNEFCGPMAKQHRMLVITLICVYATIAPRSWQMIPCQDSQIGLMTLGLVVIVVGSVITVIRRVNRIAHALGA
jgi:CheY-like chemotaxis protein